MTDADSAAAKADAQPDRIREFKLREFPQKVWMCDCCGGVFWTTNADAYFCPYCSTEAAP